MGNWLDRTDLSARLPEFIALWEAHVNRKLRQRQQTTSATLTVTAGTATLPTDYLKWKRVTWSGSPTRNLEYVTPEYLATYNAAQISGPPTYFTIEGTSLKVAPLDNTSLSFLYAQKVPALSVSATTNWMLTEHPDAYLFGSLTMAATLTEDADNGRAWNVLAEQALDEVWALEFSSHGPLVRQTTGPTP